MPEFSPASTAPASCRSRRSRRPWPDLAGRHGRGHFDALAVIARRPRADPAATDGPCRSRRSRWPVRSAGDHACDQRRGDACPCANAGPIRPRPTVSPASPGRPGRSPCTFHSRGPLALRAATTAAAALGLANGTSAANVKCSGEGPSTRRPSWTSWSRRAWCLCRYGFPAANDS
jgi:hypothetical protein